MSQQVLTTGDPWVSKKAIVVYIIIAAVCFFLSIFLWFLIPYLFTVFLALIYALNAETWMAQYGQEFSYTRALKKSWMGLFYIHNYYRQAFGTYSLDIYGEDLDPRLRD